MRQKPLHVNRKPSDRNAWTKDNLAERRGSSDRLAWSSDSFATLYIWNIHIMGNDHFLRQQFAEKGILVDFFILSKTDKSGGKFGFVRYKKPQNLSGLLKNLDDIWIGSYKIRVKLARFRRGDNNRPTMDRYTGRNSHPVHKSGWKQENVSYAEVVMGKNQGKPNNTNHRAKFSLVHRRRRNYG